MEWQPIDTAPKDGTGVLLAPHMATASWDFGAEGWIILNIPLNEDRTLSFSGDKPELWFELMADVYGVQPTHWMPLPEPPQ